MPIQQDMPTRGTVSQERSDLALFQFAYLPAILLGDTDRGGSLLGDAGLIQDISCLLLAEPFDAKLMETILCL